MLLGKQAYQKTEMQTMAERHAIESAAIQSNLSLINRSLKRYRGAVDEDTLEDLRQTALITFVTELRKFDHIVNEDFIKSVTVRMRGAIIDELRSRDYLSRDNRTLANNIKKAESMLMGQLGRAPRQSEVCEALNITAQEYLDAMSDLILSDDIALYDSVDNTEEDNKEELALFIQQELEKLPEDVQRVMYLMYVMGLSTQETALALEISEVKVHRLKHKGVEVIKSRAERI
ncbi:sigma-70 family RNA polymerase sigma factor [Vibrio ziniensis]|uniref:Sigma-70 family RNA polymerase sigma factor n=2 Tax=Vibrio TaxID=662 RepID=A0A6G7CH76_9VIBR|nr:sigma-70 family RNA polymerase sigma factor [Vibrio ziniensis]QIH41501.1 sigma-70 family RNA polymerase sigma factor [Vibrio ziniensis]